MTESWEDTMRCPECLFSEIDKCKKTQGCVIPKGTAEVRLQLNPKDHDYQDYQLVLQAIGGREILNMLGTRTSSSAQASEARFGF
jgi:hypothetical protein